MFRFKNLIFLFLLIAIQINGQNKPTAFINGKIYTATGKIINNGSLIVEKGKIIYVGEYDNTNFSDKHEVVDLSGKVILPGLIDTHSHIGIDWGFDSDSPTQPSLRIMDAINPFHDSFNRARAGGITTINIMPGSGHLMSGQTIYLKPKKVTNVYEMIFTDNPTEGIVGGMKMANGTNSMKEKPFPNTRGKSAAIIRSLFYKALDYKKKIELAGNDKSKLPSKDLELDAIVQILDKKRMVHFHTHRADDVLTVLRLKEEFGFNVVLHHVSEAWKVTKEIADAKVGCSVIVIDSPGGKLETLELKFETAKILADAGVEISIHTDDFITDSRLLLRSAAIAVRSGLSEEQAIKALTINGAKQLELAGRVGSLEVGKDADFIVLSGEPFSVYTKIEETWIEGIKTFDRSDANDLKYAVGGYDVYRSSGHLSNCEGDE
jgi:imidazolonepropionase-like amidohydrolase